MATVDYKIAQNLLSLRDAIDADDFASYMVIDNLTNYVDGISKRLNDGVARSTDDLLRIYRDEMNDYVRNTAKYMDIEDEALNNLLDIVELSLDF